MRGKSNSHIKMKFVDHTNIKVELFSYGGTMGENKKRSKSKMMFVTFMGLALIAVGVKVTRMIQEKMDKGNKYVG